MSTDPLATTRDEREGRQETLAETFQTLGSDVRLQILRELLQGERGVAELALSVDLSPVTVRYHLKVLVADGLVEKRVDHEGHGVGRPPHRYRLRQPEGVTSFPPRRYEMLANILLNILETAIRPEDLETKLHEAGREVGRSLVRTVEEHRDIASWTPDGFVKEFLEGALAQMGLVTTVVERRPDLVRYRSFICPFQELAKKEPGLICDLLDAGYHEGVMERVGGGAIQERLACMGHGDPHCEYAVRWTRRDEE